VKKSEDRDSVVVRVFNPSNETVQGTLRVGAGFDAAYELNINEERLNEISVKGQAVEVVAEAGKIVTLELTRGGQCPE
jgi:alpha-mannosidase